MTKTDIETLRNIYNRNEEGEEIGYDDLTPSLQAYADWVYANEGLARELARTKFAGWGGWNALMTAFDYIEEKIDKPPRLHYSTKDNVDEGDFTGVVLENVLDGKWD